MPPSKQKPEVIQLKSPVFDFTRQKNTIAEIINNEKSYVKKLINLQKYYIEPILDYKKWGCDCLSNAKREVIPIDQMIKVHQEFLNDIITLKDPITICKVFIKHASEIEKEAVKYVSDVADYTYYPKALAPFKKDQKLENYKDVMYILLEITGKAKGRTEY